VNQQPASVPHAVLLPCDLDLQQLTWPSNKIIPAEQAWHFLCSGRDGIVVLNIMFFYVFLHCVRKQVSLITCTMQKSKEITEMLQRHQMMYTVTGRDVLSIGIVSTS